MLNSFIVVVLFLIRSGLGLQLTYPTVDAVWDITKNLTVSWVYNATDPSLLDISLWPAVNPAGTSEGNDFSISLAVGASTSDGSFLVVAKELSWVDDSRIKVDPLKDGDVYFIVLYQSQTSNDSAQGPEFKLTNNSASISTTSTSLPKTASSALIATQSPDSTPQADGSSRLSAGAEAGVSVGASIGLLILSLLLFAFYRRRRQERQKLAALNSDPSQYDRKQLLEGSRPSDSAYSGKQELEANVLQVPFGSPGKSLPSPDDSPVHQRIHSDPQLCTMSGGFPSRQTHTSDEGYIAHDPRIHRFYSNNLARGSTSAQLAGRAQHSGSTHGSQLLPPIISVTGTDGGPDPARTKRDEDLEEPERRDINLTEAIAAARALQELEAERAALEARIKLAKRVTMGQQIHERSSEGALSY